MKNWLVIYDIRDEKRLQKVAKVMENYGIRVQKSVFEMIAKPSTINELYHKIGRNAVQRMSRNPLFRSFLSYLLTFF